MTLPALSPAPLTTASCATHAWPWQPDLGNGRFRNPIICAD